MKSGYVPRPIDTSTVVVPQEVQQLVEMLARNTHEVWSQQRLADGWLWGEDRDDKRKLHPCLVPYEELPESEKAYDRKIVAQAIEALISLGFRILPPEKK